MASRRTREPVEGPGGGASTAVAAHPLRSPVFRALWIANVVSSIGTWMHDVGAGWLMTSLSDKPIMVALVQSATALPLFVLALPAGALADIVDRRRLLIGAQIWLFTGIAILTVLSFLGKVGAGSLLLMTFVMGCGAAVSAPSFQAIVPELVPRNALLPAIALNSLGVNLARALGPALGGAIIASAGIGAVFALNAASVLGVIYVLTRWRRTPTTSALPAERFAGAIRAGIRFSRFSPPLRRVLLRSAGFFLFASAVWGLLPLVARELLSLGPGGYGVLLAMLGLGAVAGALALPAVRRRTNDNRMALAGPCLFLVAGAALGLIRNPAGAGAAMAVAGASWIAMVSTLNAAAQMAAPAWVRARALAVFILVFQGSLTVGSAVWGAVATGFGIPVALVLAGALGITATLVLNASAPLASSPPPDLTPASHWPAPVVQREVEADRGPVMVSVEYSVDPGRVTEFVEAMRPIRSMRRRDGAIGWGLFEDAARPGWFIETFVVESWLEHLRQHGRSTAADEPAEDAARSFQSGPSGPVVRHWIAP